MKESTIRFSSFPRTEPPPEFVAVIVDVFERIESQLGTEVTKTRIESNAVLGLIRPGLLELGFEVESGKGKEQKIDRPVFYGENGLPTLRYQIDAYHPKWQCGLEVEAVRAIRGGAIYRDLVQAMVMVNVEHLCIAVPNYMKVGKALDRTYVDVVKIVDALFGHSRLKVPYGLTVIGY